jgi:GNAT superfamily N-acetyltransferase
MTAAPGPVTAGPADHAAFETVMGPRGGCGGCWCMLWRLSARAFEAGKGEANRAAMRTVFAAGPPGVIARAGDEPVGWAQVAPRSAFPRLASSRLLRPAEDGPAEDRPVWSLTCFLVVRGWRRRGVSGLLLDAAEALARAGGAGVLEAYPVDSPAADYPPVYAWTGFAATFRDRGYGEAARRSPTRPILNKALT